MNHITSRIIETNNRGVDCLTGKHLQDALNLFNEAFTLSSTGDYIRRGPELRNDRDEEWVVPSPPIAHEHASSLNMENPIFLYEQGMTLSTTAEFGMDSIGCILFNIALTVHLRSFDLLSTGGGHTASLKKARQLYDKASKILLHTSLDIYCLNNILHISYFVQDWETVENTSSKMIQRMKAAQELRRNFVFDMDVQRLIACNIFVATQPKIAGAA